MFNYTVLTAEEIDARLQARHARNIHRPVLPVRTAENAVRRGLKKIKTESTLSMAKLRERILKESRAHMEHERDPWYYAKNSPDGPMIYVSQARNMNTIIVLKDYWYTVLFNERKPENAHL